MPLRPEAEAARDYNSAHERDSYEFMSVWDRCITRGAPAGMFPAGYNNAYQIIQTPGYVVIHSEMIHEARIIPIDGRPHAPAQVRQWNGDPRGRWDGKTLVVDTTNYNGKGWISTSAAGGRIKGILQTESLHVVERFTPIDKDTIDYEATIDDPKMFTRPWTVSIPLHRDPSYRIYEYACHEGNRSVGNILSDARSLEKRALSSRSATRRPGRSEALRYASSVRRARSLPASRLICALPVSAAGPAGLYFAIAMKRRDPDHEIVVVERNRPADTFGWGVVLSDETLANLHASDPDSAAAIQRAFVYWDDIAVFYRGTVTRSSGHGFCGIGRKRLLDDPSGPRA